MIVTYRERKFLDKYRCIDNLATRYFDKKWEVEGCGLIYFRRGQFEVFTIAKEDIISID